MNRYCNNNIDNNNGINDKNILTEQQMSVNIQESEQRFSSPQHSLHQVQNEEQLDQQGYLPSVKKFLSQPNPLMNKIQFTPYQPKCHYPKALSKLPKGMRDHEAVGVDRNNMNALLEAKHQHDRVKKDVLGVLVRKGNNREDDRKDLVTLEQFYGEKRAVYERFTKDEMKLEENKLKLRYFATYVLDMAKILRKQMKIQQRITSNNPATSQRASTCQPRASSVTRSTNNILGSLPLNPNLPPHSNLPAHTTAIQRLSSRRPSLNLNPSPIQFSSNFQSGNVFRVYQRQHQVYDLILQNDINTKGNTQWFFFSVKNAPKNATLRFNLVNMSKQGSLFNYGMKPYIYSMVRYQKRKVGWVRQGQKVTYEESSQLRKQSSNNPYHTLSFQYKFLYDGDVVYFAHSLPYTLSDLSCFLMPLMKDKLVSKLVRVKNVGLTLGGNEVDLLEISNWDCNNKGKRSVWILARQHPGETTSGFMLQGIIKFLVTPSQQSMTLLNNFIFKIVPMVNVDGVIHGNSRAQLIGLDPNRRWSAPNKLHTPIIASIKHHIQKDPYPVQLILDLHSHSRKLGTFFYGNTLQSNTAATRIYPLLVCKQDERFQFRNCRFSGGSNNAARFALFQSTKIPLIYTVESSFYGYVKDQFRIVPYMPKDYKEMGESLMKGFLMYEVRKKLVQWREVVENGQEEEDEVGDEQFESDSEGSDGDPGEDQYDDREFKKLITEKKDKKKKKKKKGKQPKIRIKLPVQQPVKLPSRPKINTSQSYYKQYFSGRLSMLQTRKQPSTSPTIPLSSQPKQTFSFGTQVNLKQTPPLAFTPHNPNILTQRNIFPQQLLYSKLNCLKPTIPNNLCVIGQKVEEITVYGNTVGVQVTQHKEVYVPRYEENGRQGNQTRKSFSVRQRVNSFLQVKENNFLQRGDCLSKNFFSRK